MPDYYKNSKDYKGIPFSVEYPKRDYYIEKKEEKKNTLPEKRERKTSKDWDIIINNGKDKILREYTIYPLFKRRGIILSVKKKEILERLLEYERNEKLKALIKSKIEKL